MRGILGLVQSLVLSVCSGDSTQSVSPGLTVLCLSYLWKVLEKCCPSPSPTCTPALSRTPHRRAPPTAAGTRMSAAETASHSGLGQRNCRKPSSFLFRSVTWWKPEERVNWRLYFDTMGRKEQPTEDSGMVCSPVHRLPPRMQFGEWGLRVYCVSSLESLPQL